MFLPIVTVCHLFIQGSLIGNFMGNIQQRPVLQAPQQIFGNTASATTHPVKPISQQPPLAKQAQLAQVTPQTERLTQKTASLAGASASSLTFVDTPRLGPEDRVLHIGDSHTVGIYGQEMDKHLRSTGAKVATYGSAGSSPKWWITGQTTRSGFFSRDGEEKTTRPAKWNDPHPTPKLKALLEQFRPNVVVFSLGANLIAATPTAIERQMREIAEMAKTYGTEIIWIGPPDGRESKKPTSKQNELYNTLERVAKDYGDFIDSRPLTEYPASGGDGVHYWGAEGSRVAKGWAEDVFEQIQSLPARH